jgi:aryl-alcohol dehydrogenase-like predicted oxidoreductase
MPTPSLFTFGSMSLGDLPTLDEHIRIARTAMDAGVWFHSSPTYKRGFTYMVLRMAFDEDRAHVPNMIVKIRCGSAKLLQFEVEDALRRLDIERIDVAQLVFSETGGVEPLASDVTRRGPVFETCQRLRDQGKVGQYCPQVDRASSAALQPLVNAFDGFVLYLNPIQRDIDDALWTQCQQQGAPLWALRTLGGGKLEDTRAKNPNDASVVAFDRVQPLIAESGCADWAEFCMRYAKSVPHLQTTIGGTGNLEHLNHYLHLSQSATPLPADVMAKIDRARQGSS